MPMFHYQAYDRRGLLKQGAVSAGRLQEAKELLEREELLIKELRLVDAAHVVVSLSPSQLSQFLLQLSQLLHAGFPLYEALEALKDCIDPKLTPLILAICDKIEMGSSFSQALLHFPRAFDSRLCAMITAAEHSGKLAPCLKEISLMIKKQQKWKSDLTGALIYPALLLCMTLGVVLLMLLVVVPSLEPLFAQRELSGLTAFVLGASRFITSSAALYLFGVLVLLMLYAFFAMRKMNQAESRAQLQERLWAYGARLPLVGTILKEAALARYAQMMAMLLQSGVRLIDALELAARPLPTASMRRDMLELRQEIAAGASLSKALIDISWFPSIGVHMVGLGEQSGSLPGMFEQLSQFYDERLSERLTKITALAQPVILVIMGGIVGLLMMAILSPLTDVSQLAL